MFSFYHFISFLISWHEVEIVFELKSPKRFVTGAIFRHGQKKSVYIYRFLARSSETLKKTKKMAYFDFDAYEVTKVTYHPKLPPQSPVIFKNDHWIADRATKKEKKPSFAQKSKKLKPQ